MTKEVHIFGGQRQLGSLPLVRNFAISDSSGKRMLLAHRSGSLHLMRASLPSKENSIPTLDCDTLLIPLCLDLTPYPRPHS